MIVTEKQIKDIVNAYESNCDALRNINCFYNDYGHCNNDNLPEETYEQGYNDAMEYIIRTLEIEC